MPDPLGAGVGGAHPRTRRPAGLFALPADRGPVPPGSRLQVQRPELIDAEDHFRIAVLRGRFPVGDGIQLLDPALLLRVVRVLGGFPGFQALKGGAFLSEQDPQALVADVVDHPLSHHEFRWLRQAPGGERQVMLGRLGLGDLLDLPPLAQRELRRMAALVSRVERSVMTLAPGSAVWTAAGSGRGQSTRSHRGYPRRAAPSRGLRPMPYSPAS